MASHQLLRVFCAEDGTGGNELGVFLGGAAIDPAERQAIAAELGYSETVFVDDAERGQIQIFTPQVELPFAGHPTVGTAWLLAREGAREDTLRVPAGDVAVRFDGETPFVTSLPEWSPDFKNIELGSPAEVEALTEAPDGTNLTEAWAWIDEPAGVLRARVFAGDVGIFEDEATGSAAVRLCASLGRELDIRQGRGSRILARPVADGRVEIGGRVERDG